MYRVLKRAALTTLALGAEGALPTEVRLFACGDNPTSNGYSLLFDEAAAKSVMADFGARGVKLMLDLNHDSLSEDANTFRSDASDAMAYFGLELRSGELWAVGFEWTADGERRLRSGAQRYLSPAIRVDEKTGRVLAVLNAALTAMPATHGAVALFSVPAKSKTRKCSVDPELLTKAIEALKNGDGDGALAILEQMLVAAAGGDTGAGEAPADPAADAAESAAPSALSTPTTPATPTALSARPVSEGDALMAELRKLTGKTGAGEIAASLGGLYRRLETLESGQRTLDASSRRELVGELVRLGAEVPATAWTGDPAKRVPVKRLADEPLESLRARVETLRAARPAGRGGHAPPETAQVELSQAELDRTTKMTPVQKARYFELRASRKR